MSEAHSSTIPGASHPGLLATLAAKLARALRAVHERQEARRSYLRLLESDELLRDIGITREDVLQALLESRRS